MTAEAPPTKARRKNAVRPAPTPVRSKPLEEAELIRWSPEEVVAKQLLPYKSVRSLKEKCYRREVYHHNDGGRISFSPESIRLELQRSLVAPLDTAA
ncbi:hypothetical protein QMZ92_23805 [Streptomyces sp. HNM0645]|uniref:hypothetical protein n=1 Tax=Streptomyces sp. HNM0645 TaxID=2782343 RepID=UPI0024B763B7|nr:hypothetical protein [Streptomyces sp. HNM0645]MDI9887311.1 hypothetical protein [Streptomyces sp. HNM0645]